MDYWLQISLRYDLHFPFYYGRPSSGWPTAIVKWAWYLDLFSRRLISEVSWKIVTKLCYTCSMVTVVYKTRL